jgi:hypothetical protein
LYDASGYRPNFLDCNDGITKHDTAVQAQLLFLRVANIPCGTNTCDGQHAVTTASCRRLLLLPLACLLLLLLLLFLLLAGVTTWARESVAAVKAEADTIVAKGCEREGRYAVLAADVF